MERLIDAEKLKDIISDTWILDRIDEQPTVDPVKHGHWVVKPFLGSDAKIFMCGVCDKPVWWVSDYCPNCGAKMDEDEWEEPEINPCRGCRDYDGRGGCKSNGGCGVVMEEA